jgi:ApbE superfamily uncharacterized protein (UPF0280 family)
MIGTGFQERIYRSEVTPPEGLTSFRVVVEQTDLWIAAERDLVAEAYESVKRHRGILKSYIARHPEFGTSLVPMEAGVDADGVVLSMLEAGIKADTGPMAAVAGVVAEAVAKDLARHSNKVIVENGGDLYLIGDGVRTVGIWAGSSPLNGCVGIQVDPADGIAVCTSSGTVGPSLSFGNADAAIITSPSGALADAAATALGNSVKTSDDIEPSLDKFLAIDGISGAVVVIGSAIGAAGEIELTSIDS